MADDMSLLFAFPDQSHSFVHGFEAGGLAAHMRTGEPVLDYGYEERFPLHTANIELYERMAAAYGYELEHKPTEYPEWTAVRFTRPLPKPKPKLTVVGGNDSDGDDGA